MSKSQRILFCCTGVGICNRGIESFFREAFDGLKDVPGIDALLIKGSGTPNERERVATCLKRTHRMTAIIGAAVRRNAYVVEQLTSLPFILNEIRTFRPDIVFYSDANLGFQLFRARKLINCPFRMLFSNGGPCRPPFTRTDFVQQVTPYHLDVALRAGESPKRQFFVPYGIDAGRPPVPDPTLKLGLRNLLGLPLSRKIILSVGWVSRSQKRMHYLIEEVARLPEPRPFLLILGNMDRLSREVIDLGTRLLGAASFAARSVSYESVADYYRAADVFALASLEEGFGRVYIEALKFGLPVIAHDHPVMRFVISEAGHFGDLTKAGELNRILRQILTVENNDEAARERWQSVKSRFDWKVVSAQYVAMFAAVSATPMKAALLK